MRRGGNLSLCETNVTLRESVLVEIVHRNGSLNCIIVNLLFFLVSPYRLKPIRHKFYLELLIYF